MSNIRAEASPASLFADYNSFSSCTRLKKLYNGRDCGSTTGAEKDSWFLTRLYHLLPALLTILGTICDQLCWTEGYVTPIWPSWWSPSLYQRLLSEPAISTDGQLATGCTAGINDVRRHQCIPPGRKRLSATLQGGSGACTVLLASRPGMAVDHLPLSAVRGLKSVM